MKVIFHLKVFLISGPPTYLSDKTIIQICLAESVNTGAGITEVYVLSTIKYCGSAAGFLMHQLSFNSFSVLRASATYQHVI